MIQAALFLVLATMPALADAPRPAPMPNPTLLPIETWGARNPSCLEWTDACHICARGPSGKPQCSIVGIACVQKAATCTKQAPAKP